MVYELRIRFHGVIGHVVSKQNDGVMMLLPKAGRRVVPKQVAYAKFPVSAHKGERKVIRPADAPAGTGHVVLKREELRLVAEIIDADLKFIENSDPYGAKTPTSATEKSLIWIPNLDDLAPGKGNLDPLYLGKNPNKARPRLMARIGFTKGTLATTGVDPVQVPFDTERRSDKPPRRMPIARELLLTVQLAEPKFALRSFDYKGTADSMRDLTFEFKDQTFDLVIGNESEADIYKTVLPIEPVDTLSSVCMAEFKFYYRMCASSVKPEEQLVPYLSSRPGSETCCSVVGFARADYSALDASDLSTKAAKDEITAKPKWTMLAYLAADNSLSAIADADVDKLEEGDEVGVVVQVDKTNSLTERMVLEDEGFVVVDRIKENLNSGDPAVLTKFLTKGKEHREADHYAVFLLSHGAGLLDFTFPHPKPTPPGCLPVRFFLRAWWVFRLWLRSLFLLIFGGKLWWLDIVPAGTNPDQTSGDYLDNKELRLGLRGALGKEERFAIIGFDACVMALVEMAYELRDCGDYLVASQDDVHLRGCPYNKILKKMSQQDPESAVRTIVEEYGKETEKDSFATLSGVRLKEVTALVLALDKLGEVLNLLIKNELPKLAEARNGARAFSNFQYIDLRGYVDELQRVFTSNTTVRDAAKKVAAALDQAVVCTNRTDYDRGEKNAHGLSIYLPESQALQKPYMNLDIAEHAKKWTAFVFAYSNAKRE